MPQVSRTRKVRENITTIARDGEVTINLNLKITIDGESTIKIDATASPQHIATERVIEESKMRNGPDIVPTELFSQGDELIDNFGTPE